MAVRETSRKVLRLGANFDIIDAAVAECVLLLCVLLWCVLLLCVLLLCVCCSCMRVEQTNSEPRPASGALPEFRIAALSVK